MSASRPGVFLAIVAFASACDREALESDAKSVASAATSQVRDLTDATRAEWDARLKQGGDAAARYVDERLKGWAAETEEGSIERRLAEGASSAPMVAQIAAAAAKAVDSETTILPVYRRIDAPQEDIDQAIGDMPRTEVIDGVTVGFKQLSSLDAEKRVDEKGYLVLWRKDDHLVGFVYRSRKEIDIAALVEQAPAIVRAIRGETG